MMLYSLIQSLKKKKFKKLLSAVRSSMNIVIFLKCLALAMSDFLYNITILEKKNSQKLEKDPNL